MACYSFTKPLCGIVPPLVTPLADDESLDRLALARLIEHVLSGGVSGLFVLGTTGEGPALAYQVRASLIEEACGVTDGRAPVMVGVTDTALAEAIEMANVAADAGADAVVYAPPCYFPIGQEDLKAAIRRLAAESPLPVMLYNMPALTKTVIEPSTVDDLLNEPKLIGLKDSSGDLAYFRQMNEVVRRRSDWTLMAGPEHLLAQTVALGGDGGVCGGANLYPELFVRLYRASAEGDREEVAKLMQVVDKLSRLYELGANSGLAVIQGLKAGLAERGLCKPRLSAPFAPLSNGQAHPVRALLEEIDAAMAAPANAAAPC